MAGSYNPYNPANGDNNSNSPVENKSLFSRILRSVNNWGMNYNVMVAKNSVAAGINEDPSQTKSFSMYDFFSQRAVASVLSKKAVPYLDKAYVDKKRILREYSIKDHIRDYVSRLADEIIVYDDGTDFCTLKPLSNEYSQEIRDKYQEVFEKVYNKHNFHDTNSAYNMARDFLIDGFIAFEIVYDDKKKNIIFFHKIDAGTLVPAFDPQIGNIWVQFPEDPQNRRILLDSQIIYISYSAHNEYTETSYVEGLIKPYNQLKIIEQTRIMFNIINATVYQKFVIPVKGLPKQKAEEQIGQLIQDYSEEVEWDDSIGTLSINGSKHLPYNKQIWFPEGEAGTPQMELVSPQGHNLNEDSILKWFMDALKSASKIPFQRFDKENGGGSVFNEAAEMTRDEATFGNFVARLRSTLKEAIVKPIRIQMLIEFPELAKDEKFLNSVDIQFNSNQMFETWKKLSNFEKKVNIVNNMLGIQTADGQPYFHIEYLMDRVFELSQEEKEENERYKIKAAGMSGVPGETTEGGGGAQGGMEMGGGAQGGMEMGSPEEGGGGEAPPAPEGGEAPPAPEGGGGAEEFEF